MERDETILQREELENQDSSSVQITSGTASSQGTESEGCCWGDCFTLKSPKGMELSVPLSWAYRLRKNAYVFVKPVNPILSSTYLRFQTRLGRFSPGTDGKVCPPGEFLRSPRSSLWHPPGIQKWRMWTDPCLHVAPEAAHLKGIRGNITETAWSLAGTERGRWFEPSWGRAAGERCSGLPGYLILHALKSHLEFSAKALARNTYK